MSFFEKGLDVLNRPAAASAGFAMGLLTGGNPFSRALKNFTGEERTSYQDVLKTAGMDAGLTRAVLGFAGDVLLDPTTYLTFGYGAGAKIGVGGVTKVLTKGGQAAHAAVSAAKSARLAELIPKLKQTNPKALERLMRVTGLSGVGREMAPELLAKVGGHEIATRQMGRAIEGKLLPERMEALVGKGVTGADLVQKRALRFAGMEVPGGAAVVTAPFKVAGKAYGLGEKIPIVGPALTAARRVAAVTAEAARKVFSTKTGLPEFDRIVGQYRDILDYKTMTIVAEYRDKIIKPLRQIRKEQGEKAYEQALKEINTFLEGTVSTQVREAPDIAKITEITTKIDALSARLDDMNVNIGAFEKRAAKEWGEAVIAREKGARIGAIQETKGLRQAYEQGPGEMLKQLRREGLRPGGAISKEEFRKNIPRSMWRRKNKGGVPIDRAIDNLVRSGALPQGADENDLYNFIRGLEKKPGKVTKEEILARTPLPEPKQLPKVVAEKKAALEAEIAAAQKAKGEVPLLKVKETKLVQGPLPKDPAAALIAQFIRKRFDDIWEAENKGLALPPNRMEFYLPHYMKGEVKDALIDIINSDARKIVRPEFSQRVTEAMRRSTYGKVDEIQLVDLVESGVIDPSKARDYLERRGVNLTADDMLVFENDPVHIALNRELRSIRALNSAEMARDILESPVFLKARVKLGDTFKIRQILDQHPEHALFVPTKTYIENFKTAAEREAMRMGKEKALTGSFIQEVERILLGEIEKVPAKAALEAYIIPREVAEHLSKAYSMQFDEKALNDFFRTWDKMTGWWKAFATAVRPGFHVRNEVSNLWQLMLGGVRGPAPLYKGLLVLGKNPDAVAKIGPYTGAEVKALAERYGIMRTGFVGSDIGDLVRREVDPSKNLLSTAGPVVRAGTAVGTAFEDHARLALFIDQLEKGADAASAAMHVKKYLFDYRDLTRVEKGIFRRFLPFYTWTRKSIPLGIETALTKPGYVAALGKIQEAGEKNVEDPIKNEFVASWIKEGLGVPVRKTSDGKTEFFLLKGWIPLADLAKIDVQEMFGMLHPAIKTPIELAMNKSVFTGRPIERFPGQKEKFMGVPMRGNYSYIIRNLVFMQELDRLFFKEDFDAARLATGGLGLRTYKQDKVVQMRSRVYELQDQMGELKNIVKLSTQRYGGDSGIVRQAMERLEYIIGERDRVKADLLLIDPEAMNTKRAAPAGPPKEKPISMPTTIQGMRRRIDLGRLLRAPDPNERRGARSAYP